MVLLKFVMKCVSVASVTREHEAGGVQLVRGPFHVSNVKGAVVVGLILEGIEAIAKVRSLKCCDAENQN